MEESAGNHRHHSRHSRKNILGDFLQKIFGGGSVPPQQAGYAVKEPASASHVSPAEPVPASNESLSESDSPVRKHSRKKRNPLDAWLMRKLERLADKMETRRERRNKRRYLRATMKRHRRENKSRTNIFKSLYKKYFERKSRPYGYYTLEGADKEKLELRRQRKRLAFFSINSAILYVLTYLIAYLTYQIAVMFAASRYGINSVLLFYEVFFPVGNYSDKWNSFNIIIITFAGPLISIIMGTIYLLLYVRKDRITGLRKLFYFWLGFHSVNFFLGAFIGGVITKQGFGYVIEWMFLPTVVKFGLSIVCLFTLGLIAFYYAIYFMESSGSFFWTKKSNRMIYLLFSGFIPWVAGTLFIFLLKFTHKIPQHENILVYDSIIYASMFFVIAGMFVNFRSQPMFDKTTKREGRRINWVYLVILLGLVIIFRLGLNTGLYYLPS
jgi:hypothetical protein